MTTAVAAAGVAATRDAADSQPAGSQLPEPERRWVAREEPAAEHVAALAGLRLPDLLCRLLAVRRYRDAESAKAFLKPRLDQVLDPFGLADMGAAVERLTLAIERGETILAHGDYDVDGVCGAALYTRVLRGMGGKVEAFVPHRLRDGYDLTQAGVDAALRAGATLILTADCGTVAHDAIDAARAAGIDVIVTDHHTPGGALPKAAAVVNPNRADCGYADKRLAGAGVAFKVCQALTAARGGDLHGLWYYLDLVAVATIADLAPLAGENRVFARFGLKLLAQTRNIGLRALVRSAGLDRGPIGAGQVSHVLAPRINAVGRMGDAMRGVRLLLTESEAEAERLAQELERENQARRAVDRETLHQALGMLERSYDPARDYGVVLAASGWHAGVIGIVASRVVERIHRPTVLIALDPERGRGRGSARSIPGFHLYDAIHACAATLERYGGHRQAAGLEVLTSRVDEFAAAFNERAHAGLEPDDLVVRLHVDAVVRLGELTHDLLRLFRHFAPFGIGNAAPVLVVRGVDLARPMREVGDGHAKMVLADGDARLDAIGFGLAERVRALSAAPMDVLFQVQEDRRTGRPLARVLDARTAV